MKDMTEIRQRAVLETVLLQTLAERADGLSTADTYDAIARDFDFPEDWYREIPTSTGYEYLKSHGYDDWRLVPQEKLIEMVKTEPQWQNVIRWTRNKLREAGYLDASAPRGIWKLTKAGLKVAKTPILDDLQPAERIIVNTRNTNRKKKTKSEVEDTSREALLKKLQRLTNSMPLPDLDLLIDIGRAIRCRSLVE